MDGQNGVQMQNKKHIRRFKFGFIVDGSTFYFCQHEGTGLSQLKTSTESRAIPFCMLTLSDSVRKEDMILIFHERRKCSGTFKIFNNAELCT